MNMKVLILSSYLFVLWINIKRIVSPTNKKKNVMDVSFTKALFLRYSKFRFVLVNIDEYLTKSCMQTFNSTIFAPHLLKAV